MMIHCDECIHLRWQESLFPPLPMKIIKGKRGKPDQVVYDAEAAELFDTPYGYCNAGVSITFQMPTGDPYSLWGYRPTHRCACRQEFNQDSEPEYRLTEVA
ncbi:MAG: hypothetical protein J0H02_17700 [Armatimonadetes bacterium]|nr:hypothetical protein [Armatimonadota bacterium]